MSLKVHDDMFEFPKYKHKVPDVVIEQLPEGEGIKCRSFLFKDFDVGDTVPKPRMCVDTYITHDMLKFEMIDAFNLCFPVRSMWKKRDLTDAYKTFGKHNNFGCCWNHHSLHCNFCKPKNKETIRSIKTNCDAGIKISPLFSAPPDPKSSAKRLTRKLLQGESDLVIIIEARAAHNSHDLSPTEYFAGIKRSGEVSKPLPRTVTITQSKASMFNPYNFTMESVGPPHNNKKKQKGPFVDNRRVVDTSIDDESVILVDVSSTRSIDSCNSIITQPPHDDVRLSEDDLSLYTTSSQVEYDCPLRYIEVRRRRKLHLTSNERLQAGDLISFYNPIFVFGNPQGLSSAIVESISFDQSKEKLQVKLADQNVLLPGVFYQRIATIKEHNGKFVHFELKNTISRLITDFKLTESTIPLGFNLVTDRDRIRGIIADKLERLQEHAKESNFGVDIVNKYAVTRKNSAPINSNSDKPRSEQIIEILSSSDDSYGILNQPAAMVRDSSRKFQSWKDRQRTTNEENTESVEEEEKKSSEGIIELLSSSDDESQQPITLDLNIEKDFDQKRGYLLCQLKLYKTLHQTNVTQENNRIFPQKFDSTNHSESLRIIHAAIQENSAFDPNLLKISNPQYENTVKNLNRTVSKVGPETINIAGWIMSEKPQICVEDFLKNKYMFYLPSFRFWRRKHFNYNQNSKKWVKK